MDQIRAQQVGFLKTVCLYCCMFGIGVSFGVTGPTLLDLKTQLDLDLTDVATSLPARAGGYALGSLIMGFLYDKINLFFFGSLSMGISTVLTAILPHLTNLYVFLSAFFVTGCFLGALETGANMMLLHIWGKEIAPFHQGLQFSFGFGYLLAPVIAQPFLVETDEVDTKLQSNNTSSVMNASVNTTVSIIYLNEPDRDDLMLLYPYSIVATILALNFVAMLYIWIFYGQTEEHPSRKQIIHEAASAENNSAKVDASNSQPQLVVYDLDTKDVFKKCTNTSSLSPEIIKTQQATDKKNSPEFYKVTVVAILMLFVHIYNGLLLGFGSFLVTFVVESDLKLSKQVGTEMTSCFWGFLTFWRLATIFYIEYVGNKANIIFSLTVVVIGNIIVVPFGESYEICLWVGVALIGLGISSMWSSMFSMLENTFSITSKMASILIVSALMGEFVFPMIISRFIATNPAVLLWTLLSCSVSFVILFIAVITVIKLKDRAEQQKQ